MEQTEYDRKKSILSLTFGQRIKISWGLAKPGLLPYFLLFLGAMAVFGLIYIVIISLSVMIFPIFLLLLLPVQLVMAYFWVGVNSSILKYMDGKEQTLQLSTILEPLKSWQKIFPTMLALSAILILLTIVLGVLSLIPFLGIIISQVAWLFLIICIEAYMFYLAENSEQSTNDLLTKPAKLIIPSLSRWLPALGAYILACIPSFIFTIIAIVIFFASGISTMGAYASYGASDSNMGLIAIALFFLILSLGCAFVGTVFSLFMFAIAYKQSLIDRDMNPLNSGTQAPADQYNPFNPGAPQGQAPQSGQGWQETEPSSGSKGPQKPQG